MGCLFETEQYRAFKYLSRPAAQARLAGLHELRVEEGVGGVDARQLRPLAGALHQQVHVEVDHLVVQPVQPAQRLQVASAPRRAHYTKLCKNVEY